MCAKSGGNEDFIHSTVNDLNLLKIQGQVQGSWSPYGAWGECSMTCGGGIRRRTRTCSTAPCEGDTEKTGECNVHSCVGRVSVKTEFTISFRTRRFDWEMNVINK